MTMHARTSEQRKRDVLDQLEHDVDAWVATADKATGTPYLVPLSFLWDVTTILLATTASGPTGRNLQAGGTVRLGIGPTRDVVLVEGTVHVLATHEISQQVGKGGAVLAVPDGQVERKLVDHDDMKRQAHGRCDLAGAVGE